MKISTQLVGPLDSEENLRELLSQHEMKDFQVFFKALNLNVPKDVEAFGKDLKKEEVLMEILIEEF